MDKAGYPPLKLIPPSTLFGHFPPNRELRYLECENQGSPDLHQVGFNMFIGKIKKMLLLKGQRSVVSHCF